MPTPVPMPIPLPMTPEQWQAPGKLLIWLFKILTRPIPVPETVTDTQTETGESATVFAWKIPNQNMPHFSIQVNGLHTEQIIIDTQDNTTLAMFRPEKGAALISQANVPIINASASNAYQRVNLGAYRGVYKEFQNDCLTTCIDVIEAGGGDINSRQLIRLLR